MVSATVTPVLRPSASFTPTSYSASFDSRLSTVMFQLTAYPQVAVTKVIGPSAALTKVI